MQILIFITIIGLISTIGFKASIVLLLFMPFFISIIKSIIIANSNAEQTALEEIKKDLINKVGMFQKESVKSIETMPNDLF